MSQDVTRVKHVIVAPLDWGLGHATRCIPVIRYLIDQGCKVNIGTSGDALKLLEAEFPDQKCFELPSYRATYSRWVPLMLMVFAQVPRFLWVIGKERREIKKIALRTSADLIISDNRYGCRVAGIRSVFIGHQINIIMPRGLAWLGSIVNFFNHSFISRFDDCWIPDDPKNSLSGKLSKPIFGRTKWIGLLSRFEKSATLPTEYDLGVVLSGPEPQRTILEDLVLAQLIETDLRVIVVRGLVDATQLPDINNNVRVVNHLHSKELQNIIERSKVILSRPGYSSIMDLAILGKKAIFIPTPGQTEQEYLGKQLMERRIAYCVKQKQFDLKKALLEIKNYKGFVGWEGHSNLLSQAIDESLK